MYWSFRRILVNKKVVVVGIISLIIILIISSYLFIKKTKEDIKYIAYVGRYVNNNPLRKGFDELHEVIITDYIEELNENNGTAYELKTFNCKNKDFSYKDLIDNPKIILVIDNSWGEDLLKNRLFIKDANFPVLAINADNNRMDYGKCSVFTGNNDNLPIEVCEFVKRILDKDSVIFISEYNYLLHNHFIKSFEKYNIHLMEQILVDKDKEPDLNTVLKQLESVLTSQKQVIVINTHNEWGNLLVKYLNDEQKDKLIIGHSYVVSLDSYNISESENELILITMPDDALQLDVFQAKEFYIKKFPDYFNKQNAAFFIKRCNNIKILLDHLLNKNIQNIKLNNQKKIESLAENEIATKNEILRFNSSKELIQDLYFCSFKEGNILSYSQQLNWRYDVIPNLILGIEVNSIQDLNLQNNTFYADFFYWVKYDTIFSNLEEQIVFTGIRENESEKVLVSQRIMNNLIYKLYHVSGYFYSDFELKDYPFDKQRIEIKSEIIKPCDELKISFDRNNFSIRDELADKLSIDHWNVKNMYYSVDNFISSNYRGFEKNGKLKKSKYKSVVFSIELERSPIGGILMFVFPILVIGISSISLFFLNESSFKIAGEASLGIILSLITFFISIKASSSESDVLTKLDFLFLTTFLLVFINYLYIIFMTSFERLKIYLKYYKIISMSMYFVLMSLILI